MALKDWFTKIFTRTPIDNMRSRQNNDTSLESTNTNKNQISLKDEEIDNLKRIYTDQLHRLNAEYENLCNVLEQLKRKADENNTQPPFTNLSDLPRVSYNTTSINIYTPPIHDSVLTMSSIKEQRREEEIYVLKMQEQEITKRLGIASDFIGIGDYVKAHEALKIAGELLYTIHNEIVEKRYSELSKTLLNKEEQEKTLKREKRLEENKRKKREKEERQNYINFLRNKNCRKKAGYMISIDDFRNNGIAYLYHFTSRENLKSIRKHGGLYARAYHKKIGIIPKNLVPTSSRSNNPINFSEFISLSVCKEHYIAKQQVGLGVNVCVLKIKLDVVGYYNTYFTDRDTLNERFRIGKEYQDVQNINFDAVKDDTLNTNDSNYVKKYAEVLVDSFIPSSLIENIDNPIKLI